MSEGIRFSVVIPTLGRTSKLEDTLRSVLATDPTPNEVIVVDGDPEGSAAAAVAEAGMHPHLQHLVSPPGLTRQRNVGLGAASGDVVVFLDDDVSIPSETFGILERCYADPDVIGATGLVLEDDGGRVGGKTSRLRKLLPGGGDEGGFTAYGYPRRLIDTTNERDISFMQGCFMSARLDTARRIGFDESLEGYALAEDEDFSYRLSKIGRIRYLPSLEIEHHNTGFAERDHRRFSHQVVKNRLYLFRKNFPQTVRARVGFWMLIAVLVLHRMINREWAGVRGLLEATWQEWHR